MRSKIAKKILKEINIETIKKVNKYAKDLIAKKQKTIKNEIKK